mgnify:CR=1 FL=1
MLKLSYLLIISILMGINIRAQSITLDTAMIINQIQGLLNAQCEAWNKGNIDGYMEGYWQSDSMLFTSGGNLQYGWKATLDKYKNTYNSLEKMGVLKFSDLNFFILAENAVWLVGKWELKRENEILSGVFTLIIKKFNDKWKIIHDHTSIKK